MDSDSRHKLRPRWWPLLLVVAVFAIVLLWTWQVWDAPSRQHRVLRTAAVTFFLSLAVLGWLLLLSRLRWRVRLLGLLGIAVVGVVLSRGVKVTGVSGDLVPILGWRWSPKVDEEVDRGLPTVPVDVSVPVTTATSDDFPQFLGPNRNATVTGVSLSRDWDRRPPELVWRRPVGAGWSGFAVVGDHAITLEQRGPEELTVCYDLKSGDVRWSHSNPVRFESVIAGDGPRSTPSIVDGRVFTQGATGILDVLELATGRPIWSKNVLEENGASVPEYGVAASPLIHGGMVVVVAGNAPKGALVAYDRQTGEQLWNGGDNQGRYSSPTIATLGGREQILQLYNGALRGHDPTTGDVLWQFPWPTNTEETTQPVALPGDRVFLSTGYGIGGKVIRVSVDRDGIWNAELVWESRSLKAKFTNVVVHEGYVYGLDDGILVCVDLEDGTRKWKRGRYGHGHVLLVDDLLLVVSERGEVALVDPRPDAYTELGRFQAIKGKTWNTPAIAGPYLLVRNATEAACYRLPVDAPGNE